jgi:O-antigen ligase
MKIIEYFSYKLRNGNFAYWILTMIMVILPFYYWYLPPFIILLGLLWIIENLSHFTGIFIDKSRYRTLMILFITLYLWQIAGLLYSSDIKMGLSNVLGRLSFIAFPIILFRPDKKIQDNITVLLRVFAICTLIYVLICFGYSLFRSVSITNGTIVFNPHLPEYEWQNYFFGPDFTFSIHPSYLAMFVLLSAFIAFESRKNSTLSFPGRLLWIITGFILLLSLYFIASRAGILAAIVLLLIYAVVSIFRSGPEKFIWIGIIIIMTLLFPVYRKNDRVINILNSITNLVQKNPGNGLTDNRIIAWQSSLKLIRKNVILGVGIGDVRTELVKEYDLIKAEYPSSQRLNAHNQFLEILLENGIIGFLIFSGIFCSMIYLAITEKNLLYGLFISMMFIFFMFETVLYRLAGIVFFSLFSFLLLHAGSRKSPQ